MFTLFPFTQTYTKKKHEVLDFINQMASVNGFVCFCPRGPIINMVRSMTAGRDSTGVMTAFFCIRLLVKTLMRFTYYSPAVSENDSVSRSKN